MSRRSRPVDVEVPGLGPKYGAANMLRTCRDLSRRPATMRRPNDQVAVTFFFAMTDISLRLRWTAP